MHIIREVWKRTVVSERKQRDNIFSYMLPLKVLSETMFSLVLQLKTCHLLYLVTTTTLQIERAGVGNPMVLHFQLQFVTDYKQYITRYKFLTPCFC